MTRQSRLPSPRSQSLGWLAAGALTATAVSTVLGARWPTDLPLHHQVAFALVMVLASATSVPIVHSIRGRDVPEEVSLEEAGLVLLLVLLPAGTAWLVAMAGYVAQICLRRRLTLMKLAFNVGQWAVSLGLAAFVFHAITGDAPRAVTPLVLVATVAAVVVHTAVNYVAVGLVVAAASGLPFDSRQEILKHLIPVMLTGNLLLGLAAAALWLQSPSSSLLAWALGFVVLHAYRNVVARDETADEIRIERDRLHLMMERTPAGIVLVDHAGIVTVWNPAMEDLTGLPAAAVIGQHASEVLTGCLSHPGSRRDVSLPELLSADGAGAPTELAVRQPDGDERLVAVVTRTDTDRVGAIAGVLVQFQDLTAERETARLKDDFLARISHELRTPLTSIIGFGRTLQGRGERLPDSLREHLVSRIIGAGEELERLVDNLLLVASNGDGRSGGASQRLALHRLTPVVDTAVALELDEHRGRRVEVRQLTEADGSIDPAWLTTVVRSLVCNALLYSDDLSPVVVEIDRTAEHGVIRVTDTGRGIPSSKLLYVFDRFTRVEDPLRMETRGAGLGLFIVDRLVARMGGHVDVSSTLGEGSTFAVHLPTTPVDRPPSAHAEVAGARHG